jgi:hypothetical protein
MSKRTIPNLYVSVMEEEDLKLFHKDPQMIDLIYRNAIIGIRDALRSRKKEAIVLELNSSGYFVVLNDSTWEVVLLRAQEYFIKLEEYETCSLIQQLLISYERTRTSKPNPNTNKSSIGS